MKILNQEVTEGQYLAVLDYAKKCDNWNAKSEEWKEGLVMGIKARID